jgi:hypothetical protein
MNLGWWTSDFLASIGKCCAATGKTLLFRPHRAILFGPNLKRNECKSIFLLTTTPKLAPNAKQLYNNTGFVAKTSRYARHLPPNLGFGS